MAAHSPNNPLRSLFGEGWIGPVHCAGREILRRIFVTVRDRNWQETRPTQFELAVEEAARMVCLRAHHTSDLVDFEWQGELKVSDDGRDLRFAFEGHALRDMEVCRLGLIVLHPVEAMVGSRVTVSNGSFEQSLTVQRQLAPQPIIEGIPGAMTEAFTRLRIEREDFGQLDLSFDGDAFELEDQRNWGDASFKTYCTPLRNGFPRAVKRGTSIAHSVHLRFEPPQARGSVTVKTAPVEINVEALSHRRPEIGCVRRAEALRDTKGEDATWNYIHVDLTGQNFAALRLTLESSSAPRLEIALDAAAAGRGAAECASLLRAHRERIARVLVYGEGTSLPSASAIELWRTALNGATGGETDGATSGGTSGTMNDATTRSTHRSTGKPIPLLAATRGYFVEFNRSVPFVAPIDGIAFPLTGTVHSDDAETLMGNVATVRDMAETARQLTQTSQVALAPLALYHPAAGFPTPLSTDEVRQWLAATLRHAIAAHVTSITIAENLASTIQAAMGDFAVELLDRLASFPHQPGFA